MAGGVEATLGDDHANAAAGKRPRKSLRSAILSGGKSVTIDVVKFQLVVPKAVAEDLVANENQDGARRLSQAPPDPILESNLHDVAAIVEIAAGAVTIGPFLLALVRQLFRKRESMSRQSVAIVVQGLRGDVALEITQESNAEQVAQQIQVIVTR